MARKKFTLARLVLPYAERYVGLGSEEELNNFLNPTATSADLGDPDSEINTVDKYVGKPAYDTTLGEPVWASGPDPGDAWVQATGTGGGGGGSPGGADTQIQYNNAGAFGGMAEWTYNNATGKVEGSSATLQARQIDVGQIGFSNPLIEFTTNVSTRQLYWNSGPDRLYVEQQGGGAAFPVVYQGDGSFVPTGGGTFTGIVGFEQDIVIDELADHLSLIIPGQGLLWVRNDTPNNLIFTDDAGTDFVLNAPSSALETQDNGVSLSTATASYNFQGFTITETSPDNFDIGFGVVTASEVYCPGYASYSQVSATELTVDLVNAVNTYRNRRVRIQDNLGNFDFGVVTAIDFNSTQPNDTYMSLTMDGGDSVPASITDVCVVSDTANWSPIAGDPFSGDPINDICTGIIGATQWWFAVGNNGKVATSNDGGATWTLRTTTTTEHLRACTYDTVNEQFWGGGDLGVLVTTTDGVNVTTDTTTIPAITGSGDGRIRGFAYTAVGFDGLQIIFEYNTGTFGSAYSLDQGTTWVVSDTNVTGTPTQNHSLKANFQSVGIPGPRTYMPRVANTLTRLFTTITAPDANGDSLGGSFIPNCHGFFNDGTSPDARVYGCTNGFVAGQSNWIGDDTTTFLEKHNDMAYSDFHDRLVTVGDNAQIGYWDGADKNLPNAWTIVTNGFDPTANITAVDWNGSDGVFVAVADNGQICRSSNGTN